LGQSSTTVVAEGCLPHGDLPALGHIDDVSQYRLDSCTGPAAGYEDLWCQWADETALCGAEKRAAFLEQCAEYDRVCATTPSATSNGNAASGSGCQFTAAGNSRNAWGQLLFGLAAFAFSWRRSRRER
jgi:MYXO-CTERM domain-containing protein